LGYEALSVLINEASVNPVGAALDCVPEMVRELGRAQRLFGGFGGERRQGLSLRVNPSFERDGGQFRTLLQGFVELRSVALPDAAQVCCADERQRDGDADGEDQ
jgi:hypothetical protein